MDRGIEVRLRPDGTIETATFGMSGEECLPYTEKLEQLLEAEVRNSRALLEMFETERIGLEPLQKTKRAHHIETNVEP